MKKKVKIILCLLLVSCLSLIGTKSFSVEAKTSNENQNGVIVTPDTFGSDSSIYTVLIGYDVVEIQDASFSNLVNLKEIRVDSKNPYYASCNGCLYNKDFTMLLCIPQNTTSVPVKTTITSYSEHALDGLAQSRKDALDQFLSGKGNTVNNTNNNGNQSSGTVSAGTTINNTNYNGSTSIPSSTPSNNEPDIVESDTDFSQYVYVDNNGYVCFRYTGTGHSTIIIPEGVEYVASFTDSTLTKNYEITSIVLPSTIKTMSMAAYFTFDDGDQNLYNCLYQCPNLQSVTGGNRSYKCNGSSVTRPKSITVWSNNQRIPFDRTKYGL